MGQVGINWDSCLRPSYLKGNTCIISNSDNTFPKFLSCLKECYAQGKLMTMKSQGSMLRPHWVSEHHNEIKYILDIIIVHLGSSSTISKSKKVLQSYKVRQFQFGTYSEVPTSKSEAVIKSEAVPLRQRKLASLNDNLFIWNHCEVSLISHNYLGSINEAASVRQHRGPPSIS